MKKFRLRSDVQSVSGCHNHTVPSDFNNNGRAIAVGGNHCLVLLADGTMRSWGSNYYADLGDGTHIDRHAPVSVNSWQIVAAPTLSQVSGDLVVPQNITVNCTTEGARDSLHHEWRRSNGE